MMTHSKVRYMTCELHDCVFINSQIDGKVFLGDDNAMRKIASLHARTEEIDHMVSCAGAAGSILSR